MWRLLALVEPFSVAFTADGDGDYALPCALVTVLHSTRGFNHVPHVSNGNRNRTRDVADTVLTELTHGDPDVPNGLGLGRTVV